MAAIDTKITNMKWHFEYTKVHTPNAAVLDLSDKFFGSKRLQRGLCEQSPGAVPWQIRANSSCSSKNLPLLELSYEQH